MSSRLAGKMALVTGSSAGIGEAIARRFAAEGASVMIHGRNEDAARDIAAGIVDTGGLAQYCLGDLAVPQACAMIVDNAAAKLGRIDILVNNAAAIVRGDIECVDTAAFDRAMAVNARAPLLLIQAALRHFRANKSGVVLNIGSVNSYCGERNQIAYSMSKGALMTMSRNLADALGPEGIRVNHLNPGWVLTDNEYDLKIAEGMSNDWPTHLSQSVAPSGRLLTPSEIASFAVSFVEDGAGFVTGSVVDLEQYPMIGRNPPK